MPVSVFVDDFFATILWELALVWAYMVPKYLMVFFLPIVDLGW